ncbi:hypothetical protein P4493_23565, partial [Bacillus thuringiensis]|nr:hypothetical protein [Bacillus thuringiensis]
MQNEGRYETKIVDTNETLPFVLKLIIGNEGKGDYILLNRLCTSTTALVQCIYKVQELKPIRLQYNYEIPMNITFIWNKVYEGQKNMKEAQYEINEKKQRVLIYEHGKTEFFYPWRCGLYHFEVRIEDTTYYGAFQIVPKNFFDDQFEMIQDYVKSILNELILDRGYYKKTFSALSDIEDSSYLVLLRKLPQKMKMIKQIFKKIESSSKFINAYKWEGKERKPTRRGTIVAERKPYAKHYNRKFMEQKNSKENAFLKYKAMQFYHYLIEAKSFLRQTIEILEREKKKKSEEFQAVKTIIQTIERNGSVTDREKQKYKNIHLLKEADLRKSSMKIQEYKILAHIVHENVQYFQMLMHSSFWMEVTETSNMNLHDLPIPHQQLLHHLEVLPQYTDQSPSLLFVYKPTFLVYEYYAFFIVISILEQIGLEARNSIR